ncbi:MAG: TRAM domain-containing protein [Patescibacteria group bacterium]|nr:TRAM domain-containing protein [Patescibacteria group bacterium]
MMYAQIIGGVVLLLIVAYLAFVRKSIAIRSADFAIIISGVIIGLSIGTLISSPLSSLRDPYGQWLPLVINVFSAAIVTTYVYNQREGISKFFQHLGTLLSNIASVSRREMFSKVSLDSNQIVLDTSVIIDGRILEVVRAGFLSGKLIIPKFVLNELQSIADSSEELRRSRGKRGLDVLSELRREKSVKILVVDDDYPSEIEVDSKIVKLTKEKKGSLMTVDYNLNRVANIQGIKVLNVNELNTALRPVVLPGEELKIKLVQEGKDKTQGVGYFDDGTMVVVENGSKFIGEEKTVFVTKVFQTVAGKMIFASTEEEARKTPAKI